MPQATCSGDVMGGSTVQGMLGAFCIQEGVMDMEKELNEHREDLLNAHERIEMASLEKGEKLSLEIDIIY